MGSECTEHRKQSKSNNTGSGQQPEQEQLPCPRCDSTNTKFCYYNNYNFSQPRHFCKSCRRYWTHGGTLRDIPVGGGSRKNAKRSRTTSTMADTASSAAISTVSHLNHHPILVPMAVNQGGAVQFGGGGDVMKNGVNVCGSFTSLLNNTQAVPGFLSLSGFGLGLGSNGLEDVGFGLNRGSWAFAGVGDGGASGLGGPHGGGPGMGNMWQLENGEGGFVGGGGDCFSWPDLAISTPGNGLK